MENKVKLDAKENLDFQKQLTKQGIDTGFLENNYFKIKSMRINPASDAVLFKIRDKSGKTQKFILDGELAKSYTEGVSPPRDEMIEEMKRKTMSGSFDYRISEMRAKGIPIPVGKVDNKIIYQMGVGEDAKLYTLESPDNLKAVNKTEMTADKYKGIKDAMARAQPVDPELNLSEFQRGLNQIKESSNLKIEGEPWENKYSAVGEDSIRKDIENFNKTIEQSKGIMSNKVAPAELDFGDFRRNLDSKIGSGIDKGVISTVNPWQNSYKKFETPKGIYKGGFKKPSSYLSSAWGGVKTMAKGAFSVGFLGAGIIMLATNPESDEKSAFGLSDSSWQQCLKQNDMSLDTYSCCLQKNITVLEKISCYQASFTKKQKNNFYESLSSW